MAERDLTAKDVECEHLDQVDPRAHWAYIAAVLGGSTLLMLAFIGCMGAAAS